MTPGVDSGRKNPSKLRGMSSRTGLWMILAFTLGYLGAADRSRADLAHPDHRRRGLSISRAPLPEIPPSLQTTTTTAARRQQTTLSPLKWEARMGSASAQTSVSFWRTMIWTEQKLGCLSFAEQSWKCNSRMMASEPGIARWQNFNVQWRSATGDSCRTKHPNTSVTSAAQTGATGPQPMLPDIAMQASDVNEAALCNRATGNASATREQCGMVRLLATAAPWLARNLRTRRFQHPNFSLKRLHRVIGWYFVIPDLPYNRAWLWCRRRPTPSTTCASWQVPPPATGLSVQPKGLCTLPHKAHNLSYPRLPKDARRPIVHKSGQPGPKSGASLQITIISALFCQTSGVRVVSDVAAGTELASARKPCGNMPMGGPPTSTPLRLHKRAFRRARARAERSNLGGTNYRGRWHTTESLRSMIGQQPVTCRTAAIARPPRSRPVQPIRVLSWNATILASGLFQELMAWLDSCPANKQYHLIMIQETHWRSTTDFQSGSWKCMHSSGYDCPTGVEKSSGVLLLASTRHFKDIAIKEVCPGRLLQMQATLSQTNRPITIFNVYQHVWRSHLSTVENHRLRTRCGTHLNKAVTKYPRGITF